MERGVLETHAARNGGKRVERVRLGEDWEGREIRKTGTETGEGGKGTRMDGRMDGKERMGSFAILSSLVAGIDRRIKPRQTYFPFCLLAAYTVFCDEDFGLGPSSFQMDVLHHEFSESMFCWYITSPFREGGDGQPRVQHWRAQTLETVCIGPGPNQRQPTTRGFVQRKSISA